MSVRIHELKTWPEFFAPLFAGEKTFEVRKNDRDFQPGDQLRLREWQPTDFHEGMAPVEGKYTGAEVEVTITYVMRGGRFGIDPEFAVLGFH